MMKLFKYTPTSPDLGKNKKRRTKSKQMDDINKTMKIINAKQEVRM